MQQLVIMLKVKAFPKITLKLKNLQSHSKDLKHPCQYNWFNNMQVESSWSNS